MTATKEELAKIVAEHDITVPECGSYEASFEAFAAWYATVKDKPSGCENADGMPVTMGMFDVRSLLGEFDADLAEFAKIKNEKGTEE